MLEPGDVVFIDTPRELITLHTPRWTVASVERRDGVNYHKFEGWPDPKEEIPGSRITAHWVQT